MFDGASEAIFHHWCLSTIPRMLKYLLRRWLLLLSLPFHMFVHMSFSTIDGCCFFLYCPVYCRSILSNATKIAPPSICLIHDIPLFSLSRETNGHLSKDLSNMETPNFTHLVIFCHEKFYFSHTFASYLSNFGPNVRGLATKFWRPEHISNFLHTLYLFVIDYVCNNKRLILCE